MSEQELMSLMKEEIAWYKSYVAKQKELIDELLETMRGMV